MSRSDSFSERIHALKVLAVVRHDFAGAPQIIQCQGAILAAALATRWCARRHLKVAVVQSTTLVQQDPHFSDGISVVAAHFSYARVTIGLAVALAAHDHAPIWQLIHRSGGQPATPIKKFALLIGYVLPHARGVIEHAAVQRDIMAASDDL